MITVHNAYIDTFHLFGSKRQRSVWLTVTTFLSVFHHSFRSPNLGLSCSSFLPLLHHGGGYKCSLEITCYLSTDVNQSSVVCSCTDYRVALQQWLRYMFKYSLHTDGEHLLPLPACIIAWRQIVLVLNKHFPPKISLTSDLVLVATEKHSKKCLCALKNCTGSINPYAFALKDLEGTLTQQLRH